MLKSMFCKSVRVKVKSMSESYFLKHALSVCDFCIAVLGCVRAPEPCRAVALGHTTRSDDWLRMRPTD
ncbi:hypothetical protein ROA7745_03461 [Roseovarius aestuarii]|uniref:Uncharacterized protein n=1 Tax=Roseovarius aestuarii TaxID=475083 RepID=A0A1X7BVI8_9RHOB|nr:hypothetical protein ROA7745_03461 [Roseovarius aestuarii]